MAGPGGREVGRVSIRVVPDTSRMSIDLKTELAAIEARNKLHIATELDTSGLTEHARLAVKEAEMAAGKIHIKTDVDSSGLQSASRSINGLVLAAIALGPALIPLGAALVGVFFPLLGILTAATAGAVGFGAVLIPQLTEIAKVRKKVTEAELAYTAATTDKARAAALKAQAAALAQLNPAQRAASDAMTAFSAAYQSFQNALAPTVLPVFTEALSLLAKALPGLTPFVQSASAVFSGLLSELDRFGSSDTGKGLLSFFQEQVGPAIFTLGRTVGNVFVGLFGLMRAFGPLIAPISAALVGATASFAKFGTTLGPGNGFQSFIAYLQKTGPQVISFLSAFIGASVKLVQGLAPIGGAILVGVTALLKVFSALPTGVVTALGVAVLGVAAALVIANAVTAAGAAIQTIHTAAMVTGAVATKIFTAGQWLLNAAMSANPIGLVVIAIALLIAGIVLAWQHSEKFRTIVIAVWEAVKGFVVGAVTAVVNFVKAHWPLLLAIIAGPLGLAVLAVIKYWDRIKSAISAAVSFVIDFIKSHWKLILGILTGPFGLAIVAIATHWSQIKGAVRTGISTVVELVKGFPARILSALGDLGKLLFGAGKQVIQGLIDGIQAMIGAVGGAMKKVAGKIGDFIPGSPVKEGPLRVLNNGRAGGLITQMLADGIIGNSRALSGAMRGIGTDGLAASGAVGNGASSTNNFTINAAPNVPTEEQILTLWSRAEALHFSPA